MPLILAAPRLIGLSAVRASRWKDPEARRKLVGVDSNRIRRQVHQSRDYFVEKAGWPKTLFGGYLPGH